MLSNYPKLKGWTIGKKMWLEPPIILTSPPKTRQIKGESWVTEKAPA